MRNREFDISIIVPLYNEEDGMEMLLCRLDALLDHCLPAGLRIEIILVDDGSKDNTPLLIKLKAADHPAYRAVILSRNFGHQMAVSAGLTYASGTKAVFIIDGDLQDPPELLPAFYEKLCSGYDVVYGIRKKRKEPWYKPFSYAFFYRLLGKISTIQIPMDSGDFSLISRRVANLLVQMPEESRFLRGMRSWVGFKQAGITYEREGRHAGEPKYSFRKLWKLAKDGIFNFSEVPVALMQRTGLLAILLSITYFIYILFKKILYQSVPPGFTTLVFMIILFAGLQFIFLGILGEYVLRIFFQVKKRPHFIVKECTDSTASKTIEHHGKEKQEEER